LAIGLTAALSSLTPAQESAMRRERTEQALERWKSERTAEDFLLLVPYMKSLPSRHPGQFWLHAESVFGKADRLGLWSVPICVEYVLSDGRIGRIVYSPGSLHKDVELPAGVILPPR
jgi:hypothetical protein